MYILWYFIIYIYTLLHNCALVWPNRKVTEKPIVISRNVAKLPWIDRWKSLGWRVLPVSPKQCLPKLCGEWVTSATMVNSESLSDFDVNSESLSDFDAVRFSHTTTMGGLHHGVWTFSSVRKPHRRESMSVAKLDCLYVANAKLWNPPQNAAVAVEHYHIGSLSLSALYDPSLYQGLQAGL